MPSSLSDIADHEYSRPHRHPARERLSSIVPGLETVLIKKPQKLFQVTSVKLNRQGYEGYWATKYTYGLMFGATVALAVVVGTIVYMATQDTKFVKVYDDALPHQVGSMKTKACSATSHDHDPHQPFHRHVNWEKLESFPIKSSSEFVPLHYELIVHPQLLTDLKSRRYFVCSGTVKIHFFAIHNARSIVLDHGDEIGSDGYRIVDSLTGVSYALEQAYQNKTNQAIKVLLPQRAWLKKNRNYIIMANFTSNRELQYGTYVHTNYRHEFDYSRGLHFDSYMAVHNELLVISQLSRDNAKHIFPCFNNPSFKSTFTVSIIRPVGLLSLSNMRLQRTSLIGPQAIDVYETTKPMPIYRVTFAVGNFTAITHNMSNTRDHMQVRIWTTFGLQKHTSYAMEVCQKVILFLEQFLDMSFPLKKIDIVSVNNSAAESLDSHGLAAFFREDFLCDMNTSTNEDRTRIALKIAGMLTKQFINLVSIVAWDDMWAFQAVSDYVAYLAVNSLTPYDMAQEHILLDTFTFMRDDSFPTVHPLQAPGPSLRDIRLQRMKGLVVARMYISYIGHSEFRRVIQTYMKRNADSVVAPSLPHSVPSDYIFWHSAYHIPTEILMNIGKGHSYRYRSGYPLLHLDRSPTKQSQVAVLTERYRGHHLNLDHVANATEESRVKKIKGEGWNVLLTYSDSILVQWDKPTTVITNGSAVHIIAISENAAWYLTNIGLTGFYRVNYDLHNWWHLATQLQEAHTLIPTTNRAQLIDDAISLCMIQVLDADFVVNITQYLVNEQESLVWKVALDNFEILGRIFSYGNRQTLLGQYIIRLMKDLLTKTTWNTMENEDPHKLQLRHLVLETACRENNRECVDRAFELFKEFMTNPDLKSIPNDLRDIVYCYGVKNAGLTAYNLLQSRYIREDNPAELGRILKAMACTDNPIIISRYLNFTLSQELWKPHYPLHWLIEQRAKMLMYVGLNTLEGGMALSFLERHRKETRIKYSVLREEVLPAIVSRFVLEPDLAKMEMFDEAHPDLAIEATHIVRHNINFYNGDNARLLEDKLRLLADEHSDDYDY